MKFAKISETVLLAGVKNSISDFKLDSINLRKVENTAKFPGWETGRPKELSYFTLICFIKSQFDYFGIIQ